MRVYENGRFTEVRELDVIFDEAARNSDGNYQKTLKALGYTHINSYYSPLDQASLGLEVHSRVSLDNPNSVRSHMLRDYSLLVDIVAGESIQTVLVKRHTDYLDLLGRYLPVIEKAGQLEATGDYHAQD